MHKLSIAALALLVACAVDGGRPEDQKSLDWRSGGKADGQSCDFGQLSAADYYKQFSYVTDADGWYRIGASFLSPNVGNGDGTDLTLYFLDGGRVIAEYSELHRVSSSESDTLDRTVIVTRATIDPATRAITIPGIGTGKPVTLSNGSGGCAAGIDLTYTTDVRAAGLTGKSVEIAVGSTTARVQDPDNLDNLTPEGRAWFQEDVQSGAIVIQRPN